MLKSLLMTQQEPQERLPVISKIKNVPAFSKLYSRQTFTMSPLFLGKIKRHKTAITEMDKVTILEVPIISHAEQLLAIPSQSASE